MKKGNAVKRGNGTSALLPCLLLGYDINRCSPQHSPRPRRDGANQSKLKALRLQNSTGLLSPYIDNLRDFVIGQSWITHPCVCRLHVNHRTVPFPPLMVHLPPCVSSELVSPQKPFLLAAPSWLLPRLLLSSTVTPSRCSVHHYVQSTHLVKGCG